MKLVENEYKLKLFQNFTDKLPQNYYIDLYSSHNTKINVTGFVYIGIHNFPKNFVKINSANYGKIDYTNKHIVYKITKKEIDSNRFANFEPKYLSLNIHIDEMLDTLQQYFFLIKLLTQTENISYPLYDDKHSIIYNLNHLFQINFIKPTITINRTFYKQHDWENTMVLLKEKIKTKIKTFSTDGDACPICYDTIDEKRALTSCNHVFCINCIYSTFHKTNMNCPICRTDLTHTTLLISNYPQKIKLIDRYISQETKKSIYYLSTPTPHIFNNEKICYVNNYKDILKNKKKQIYIIDPVKYKLASYIKNISRIVSFETDYSFITKKKSIGHSFLFPKKETSVDIELVLLYT